VGVSVEVLLIILLLIGLSARIAGADGEGTSVADTNVQQLFNGTNLAGWYP